MSFSRITNEFSHLTLSQNHPNQNKQNFQGDRYIPNRKSSNLIYFPIDSAENSKENSQLDNLYDSLFTPSKKIFKYHPLKQIKPIQTPTIFHSDLSLNILNISKPQPAYKVLDAPNLLDDFYLNLLDWSSQSQIGVGLASCVYLWSQQNSHILPKITKIADFSKNNNYPTSIQFHPVDSLLTIGTYNGDVELWDLQKVKKIRSFEGHESRVGTISWSPNNYLFSTGSRDKKILNRDIRISENYLSIFENHRQEVCGLKWSKDGQHLASGGNDNRVFIWSLEKQDAILYHKEHKAAVKALDWSNMQHGVLASGGGTADQCIKVWNINENKIEKSVQTGSQICCLRYSKTTNEIITGQGYSENVLKVWDYGKDKEIFKKKEFKGHSARILYLGISPDGENVVSGGGDETLRFWKIFQKNKNNKEEGKDDLFVKRITNELR